LILFPLGPPSALLPRSEFPGSVIRFFGQRSGQSRCSFPRRFGSSDRSPSVAPEHGAFLFSHPYSKADSPGTGLPPRVGASHGEPSSRMFTVSFSRHVARRSIRACLRFLVFAGGSCGCDGPRDLYAFLRSPLLPPALFLMLCPLVYYFRIQHLEFDRSLPSLRRMPYS